MAVILTAANITKTGGNPQTLRQPPVFVIFFPILVIADGGERIAFIVISKFRPCAISVFPADDVSGVVIDIFPDIRGFISLGIQLGLFLRQAGIIVGPGIPVVNEGSIDVLRFGFYKPARFVKEISYLIKLLCRKLKKGPSGLVNLISTLIYDFQKDVIGRVPLKAIVQRAFRINGRTVGTNLPILIGTVDVFFCQNLDSGAGRSFLFGTYIRLRSFCVLGHISRYAAFTCFIWF